MKTILEMRKELRKTGDTLDGPTHAEQLEQKGFYSVTLGLNGLRQWQYVHQWCQEQFGEEHYTWTGSIFWFEDEKHAMLFALRWR